MLRFIYKANIDDCSESPSFVLMEKLLKKVVSVDYIDPFAPVVPLTSEHTNFYR
jgi:UDP-N-acetyl-D-glucosamine dehydrogenase